MRVLHVLATNERRGAELFAADLVRELASLGIEQQVLLLRGGAEGVVPFQASVEVIGGSSHLIPGVRLDRSALRRIRKASQRDVIVAHGGGPLKHALAARGSGARVVYRRIGDRTQFGGHGVKERAFAVMLRRCARVVAVADVLRTELIDRYHLDPEHVVSIPNGVDPDAFQPSERREEIRRKLGVAEGVGVVISLGALTWEKDPVAHVAIVRRAAEVADIPVMHLFAGDGPLRERLTEATRNGDHLYQAQVLGSRADVPDLLAASDLLLLASRTEGMPACIIEAGIAGLPVVAYALSGVPEVVENGVTGIVVDPGGDAGLSLGVAALLRDPSERARLGANARKRCRERFTIGAIAPRYLEVFEEVAGLARKRA